MISSLFNNIEISRTPLKKCLLKEPHLLKFKRENFVFMLMIINEPEHSISIGSKRSGELELIKVPLLVSYKQQKNDLIQKLSVQIQSGINQLPIQNLNCIRNLNTA